MKSQSIEYGFGWKSLSIGYDWENFDLGLQINKWRIYINLGFFFIGFGKI
jgi:hypothetical protein